MPEQAKAQPIVVKRYAGNRLYDTAGGRYVTIDDLKKWANGGIELVVIDANSGEDITRELMG